MDQTFINRIVEAALLASTQPLTLAQLGALFTLDEPAPDGSLRQALEELQAACADRGVELVELASGWRYQVRHDVHGWVSRLWTERQTRYTRATLETLALIAYRQPITRGEIEQVRGVATNSNIIKALEEREWIRVVGHRDMPGRPELLGTTKGFLDYFGLKRLDELPPLSELKDFAELDPQLRLAGADTRDDLGDGDGRPDDRGVGGIASGVPATHPADNAAIDGSPSTAEAGPETAPDTAPLQGIDDARADTDAGAPDTAGHELPTPYDAADDGVDPQHPDTDADPGDRHLEPDDALAADGDSDRSTS
ncbi:SMC-Scp complex subunit ScpB [Luteimonas sp. SJ-16]|uniref:SMC-Scp complex subunit ScpB n=1 Tax=Luteimonas deserti TaxID=2752306 RepID=A0A7Z0TW86_9GAMM|nr:SMC-Scp complex subunit ScpB [Luteimonas deserti]